MLSPIFSKIYVSEATQPFDHWALRDLAALSQERNEACAITGYLIYLDGRFVQYFEGPQGATEQLMANIRKDTRHTVLQEAGESNLTSRRFPTWFMRWLHEEDLVKVQAEWKLAELLANRTSMLPKVWEARLWLTVESIVVLDRS